MRGWSRERLLERFRQHRGLIGYLMFVTVVFVAIEYHQESVTHDLKDGQRIACINAQTITANQRLVLNNLISLRIAALDSPYLRLEARRELPDLQQALAAISPAIIEEACK